MGYPQWMYHNDHEAKIFDSEEIPALEQQGWRDSPAKLSKEQDTIETEQDASEEKTKRKRGK